MDDFYVVLPSNSNPNTHPNNNASNYVVSWENPILLNNVKEWKVALTEMSFNFSPRSVTPTSGVEYDVVRREKTNVNLTIEGVPNQKNIDYHHDPFVEPVYSPYDNWKTPHIFIDENNHLNVESQFEFNLSFANIGDAKLCGFSDTIVKSVFNAQSPIGWILQSNKPFLHSVEKQEKPEKIVIKHIILTMLSHQYTSTIIKLFDTHTHWDNVDEMMHLLVSLFGGMPFSVLLWNKERQRIELEIHEKVFQVRFLNNFNYVMGFANKKLKFEYKKRFVADYSPQLNRGLNHMYIYASICAPIQVGHTRVPLLKSIWLDVNKKYREDEVRSIDVKHPMYVPINSTTINSIEINIRTDSGSLVPFSESAVTSITLHFKKKAHD